MLRVSVSRSCGVLLCVLNSLSGQCAVLSTCIVIVTYRARRKNVLIQSAYLFTLSNCRQQIGMLFKLFVANYLFVCAFCKINIVVGL